MVSPDRVRAPGGRPGRRGVIGGFRHADRTTRLLVSTQLAFNVGFYLVLPYLAVHLARDLGLAAGLVGLILGLRTFSQQGLFVVGGTLADRFGTKPVVLTGCVVRIGGFVGLAFATTAVAALVATVAIGVAAALFSPAVEAALGRDATAVADGAPDPRVDRFALFTVFGQIGAFTGPLLGALLLLADFRIVCLAGAAVFVGVLVAHAVWLPRLPAAHAGESMTDAWREVRTNRRFLVFALAFSAHLVAYNQVYQLLPQEIDRAWGSQTPLSVLLAGSSLLVVAGQLRMVQRFRDTAVRVVLPLGFVLMAAGFLLVAVAVPFGSRGLAGLLPAAAFVLLLTLGEMVVLPFVRALVPGLAGERRFGAYYGALASIGGLAVLIGSTALGGVVQLVEGSSTPVAGALPWLVAAAVPLAGAVAMWRLFAGARPEPV